MLYRVELIADAEADLAALPAKVQRQIVRKLESLAANPTPPGVKALQGTKERTYRIRSGDYRIVYRIEAARLVVLVLRIAPRRDVYRNLPG